MLTHLVYGHREMGSAEKIPGLAPGSDYRAYLYSLTAQELAVEHSMTAYSCLTKLRQLEHDCHFAEERLRQYCSLPHENLREFQQCKTALAEAEANAILSDQADARACWKLAQDCHHAAWLRGGCLSGLYSWWWNRQHQL